MVHYELVDDVSQASVSAPLAERASTSTVQESNDPDLSALGTIANVSSDTFQLPDTTDSPSSPLVVSRSRSRANTLTDTACQNQPASPTQVPVSLPESPGSRTSMSGEAANEIDRSAQVTEASLNKSFPTPQNYDDLDIQ